MCVCVCVLVEGREAYLFDSKCLHPLTLIMYTMHVMHSYYCRVVAVVSYFLVNAIMKDDEEDIVVLLKCLILTIVCVGLGCHML